MYAILQHMLDTIGHQTLEIMAQAEYYNDWIYSIIAPFIRGSVAEVGAGTGTFSDLIQKHGFKVTAIDYSPEYLKIISKKNKKIKTKFFDLQSKSLPADLTSKFDTIVILNVVEHLSDHFLAMKHLTKMLKKGGKLIVLVPSFKFAYGSLDKYLGHYRRYDIKSFEVLVKKTGLDTIFCRYINILGLLGWFINAKILMSKTIPNSQVKVFNIISRPLLSIEKRIKLPIGLSLISISSKI